MQSILKSNRRADISFSQSGQINLSAHLVKALDLHPGDAIDVKTDGHEYYLYVRSPASPGVRYEAQCFPSNKKGKHFRAYSCRLCKAILAACNCVEKADLPTGEVITEGDTKYIAIITKLILNHD